jgi:hypothetical protein
MNDDPLKSSMKQGGQINSSNRPVTSPVNVNPQDRTKSTKKVQWSDDVDVTNSVPTVRQLTTIFENDHQGKHPYYE